jgi:acetoin utilization deacetylase AcuC-like enzyme
LAERLGHGRLLATGGGGYHRPNIATAWNAVVEHLFA